MFESKYSNFLTVLLVIIIIAIIGLIGFLGYRYYTNSKTASDADEFVSSFVEEASSTNTTVTNDADLSFIDDINTVTASGSSAVKQYKGYNVIGTIEITKTNISYPILEAPPTVKKLETSICALYPQDATLNTVGNVVLVGHNYRNSLFFSNNKNLENGDKIYITDLEGNKVTYTVYSVFTASENDTSFYNRDTDGAMEITLSTCTDDTTARTIVEARAEI